MNGRIISLIALIRTSASAHRGRAQTVQWHLKELDSSPVSEAQQPKNVRLIQKKMTSPLPIR